MSSYKVRFIICSLFFVTLPWVNIMGGKMPWDSFSYITMGEFPFGSLEEKDH